MPFNYARMAMLAAQQIRNFGAAVTFTRTHKAAAPLTGGTTADALQMATGWAVQVPINDATSESAFDGKLADGGLAGRTVGYLKVAAYGLAFAPAALDRAIWQGGAWEVLGCTPVNPAGTPIVYGVGMVKL